MGAVGSGSCQMVGFGISDVEHSSPTARELSKGVRTRTLSTVFLWGVCMVVYACLEEVIHSLCKTLLCIIQCKNLFL